MDSQIGLLMAADTETIFLDEIGAMPVKLLLFVKERTLIRVKEKNKSKQFYRKGGKQCRLF